MPRGIILSGGPDSVYEKGAPACDPRIYDLGIPILGVCYGMQLLAKDLGGKVVPEPSASMERVTSKSSISPASLMESNACG